MTRQTRQTLLAATLLVLLFGVVKHAARLNAQVSDVGFLLTMVFQLYVPAWLIRKEGSSLEAYGIRFERSELGADLRRVLILSLLTFVPFALASYGYWSFVAAERGLHLIVEPQLPSGFWTFVLSSFLLVALPEEVFYRGFVQNRLLKEWPNERVWWGVPLGRAILITSAFFALGHFIGEYHPARLLPFFPALLFSYLAFRSRSIFGAVVYHALCNIFAELLHSSFFVR